MQRTAGEWGGLMRDQVLCVVPIDRDMFHHRFG